MALADLVALVVVVGKCHCSFVGVASSNPVAVPLSNAAGQFLEAHNQARAKVGVAPLKWSGRTLANAASRWVRYQRNNKGCDFANLNGVKYGSVQSRGGGKAVTPRKVVQDWVKEKIYYTHTDNSCAPNRMCSVYTQVVWRKSLELGCAQALCVKDPHTLTYVFIILLETMQERGHIRVICRDRV